MLSANLTPDFSSVTRCLYLKVFTPDSRCVQVPSTLPPPPEILTGRKLLKRLPLHTATSLEVTPLPLISNWFIIYHIHSCHHFFCLFFLTYISYKSITQNLEILFTWKIFFKSDY